METNYDDQLAKVVGKIEQLANELLARPDRQEGTVINRYLTEMDRLKKKILDLKTKRFLDGGLYQ